MSPSLNTCQKKTGGIGQVGDKAIWKSAKESGPQRIKQALGPGRQAALDDLAPVTKLFPVGPRN